MEARNERLAQLEKEIEQLRSEPRAELPFINDHSLPNIESDVTGEIENNEFASEIDEIDDLTILLPSDNDDEVAEKTSPITFYLLKSTLKTSEQPSGNSSQSKRVKKLTRYDLERNSKGIILWPSLNSHVIIGSGIRGSKLLVEPSVFKDLPKVVITDIKKAE